MLTSETHIPHAANLRPQAVLSLFKPDVSLIPMDVLAAHCDPFKVSCWAGMSGPLSMEQVQAAVEGKLDYPSEGRVAADALAALEQAPWQGLSAHSDELKALFGAVSPAALDVLHAKKVAHFVLHGFLEPLDIDVGIPGMTRPQWLIADGNHRWASLLYRWRAYGEALVAEAQVSGSVEYAVELGLLPEAELQA